MRTRGSGGGGAPLWTRIIEGDRADRPAPECPAWRVADGIEPLPPPEGAAPGCPLPRDWEEREYVALDVETTGLDPSADRIVEIGIVSFRFDRDSAIAEESRWGTLVNPGMPIPPGATGIHGITDLEVSGSPRFADIADMLAERIRGRVLVAHNAPFDSGFLRCELSRSGRLPPAMDTADSLVFCRLAFPGLVSYSLGKAAFILGIDTGTSHRAMDDALTCMRIFARCARRLAGSCP